MFILKDRTLQVIMTVVFKYLKYSHVEGKSELFRVFQRDRIINYKEQISAGHENYLVLSYSTDHFGR